MNYSEGELTRCVSKLLFGVTEVRLIKRLNREDKSFLVHDNGRLRYLVISQEFCGQVIYA